MPAAGDVRAPAAVPSPAALSLRDDGAAERADDGPAVGIVSAAAAAAAKAQVVAKPGGSERITLGDDGGDVGSRVSYPAPADLANR